MVSNGDISPASALPNIFTAAVFARSTTQLALNSNAGHAAPSSPNTISGFIQTNSNNAWQPIVLLKYFKE
jgi:hypothetical protein